MKIYFKKTYHTHRIGCFQRICDYLSSEITAICSVKLDMKGTFIVKTNAAKLKDVINKKYSRTPCLN